MEYLKSDWWNRRRALVLYGFRKCVAWTFHRPTVTIIYSPHVCSVFGVHVANRFHKQKCSSCVAQLLCINTKHRRRPRLARKLVPNTRAKEKKQQPKNEIKSIDDVSKRNKNEIVNKKQGKSSAVYLHRTKMKWFKHIFASPPSSFAGIYVRFTFMDGWKNGYLVYRWWTRNFQIHALYGLG